MLRSSILLIVISAACGGGNSDQPDGSLPDGSLPDGSLADAPGPDAAAAPADAGPPDADTRLAYRVTYDDVTPVVGSTVTVTAQLLREGQPIGLAGRVITWSGSGEFLAGSTATDAAGRASVQHRVVTTAGATDTVMARDAEGVRGEATAVTRAAPPSPVTSTVRAAITVIPADLQTTTTITVTLRDSYLNVIAGSASVVTLTTTLGTLGPVTNRGDGSYVATLTAGDTAGVATLTGMLDGSIIAEAATVAIVLGPGTGYRVTAASAIGMSTLVTVSAQLIDARGQDVHEAGHTLTWWSGDRTVGGLTYTDVATDAEGRAIALFTSAYTFADGAVHVIDELGLTGSGKVTIAPRPDDSYFKLVSGGYQSWMPSQTLPIPPKLTYYGPGGTHPRSVVTFTTPDGSVTGDMSTTAVDGSAAVGSWTLPNRSGLLHLTARTDTGYEMSFEAEAYGTIECACHPSLAGGTCNLALYCRPLLSPPGARLLVTNVTSRRGSVSFDLAVQNGDDTHSALGPAIRLVVESASAGVTFAPAADGKATFTAADQPYYEYVGLLAPGQTSTRRPMTVTFPMDAATVSLRFLVAGPRSR